MGGDANDLGVPRGTLERFHTSSSFFFCFRLSFFCFTLVLHPPRVEHRLAHLFLLMPRIFPDIPLVLRRILLLRMCRVSSYLSGRALELHKTIMFPQHVAKPRRPQSANTVDRRYFQ